MKLSEKQLDQLAEDLILFNDHFSIFEKRIKWPKKTSFEKKLKFFNSIYQSCKVSTN
tara:strand:+ start:250 stop:420 length:171 start_codon:yes stop_codon:yes gene_type:complete